MSRIRQAAKLGFTLALLFGAACSEARADDPFLDELARYALRTDGMSVMSGDANEANAAKQIIDPWPANVQDRKIPINGQRMLGAIDRYQNPDKLGAKAPTLAPIITESSGSGGGSGQ